MVHAYGLWDFSRSDKRESHVLARVGLGPCKNEPLWLYEGYIRIKGNKSLSKDFQTYPC